MANELTGYDLSRNWFDFCFENPEKISPNHHAIFFFAIEHCNRLGWKEKFGFPTQMAMDAVGIKKHETYIRYFLELCEWGFFNLVQRSVNQYSANIISLRCAIPKNGKALGKAIRSHAGKQTHPIGESIGESNSSINKPITYNLITKNQEQENDFFIIPEMEKIFREYILIYPSEKEKDYTALFSIAEFIINQNDATGPPMENIELVISEWRVLCGLIKKDKFYSSKSLKTIAGNIQSIYQLKNNGTDQQTSGGFGKKIEFDAA